MFSYNFQLAEILPDSQKSEVTLLCQNIESGTQELVELCRSDAGDSPRANALAKSVAANLNRLKDVIRTAIVDRVVEDFMDAGTSLKQFTNCVVKPGQLMHFGNI